MPKSACSVGNQNVEAGEKERGSGEKTTSVAKMCKKLAKKNCIICTVLPYPVQVGRIPDDIIDQ